MNIYIKKTCLDNISFDSFINLMPLKNQELFFEKINFILDNKFWFFRDGQMEQENENWTHLISKQKDLTDNFDTVYATYFFEGDESGITYDFHIILKCKTMPFIVRFLFDTEPDNYSDKNDLDIFSNIESALKFFSNGYNKEGAEKSLRDYEIIQNHTLIENKLSSKKKTKPFKI